MLKAPKKRTCKVCKEKFLPTYNTIQPCCSIPCLIIHGKAIRTRSERRETKERLKSRSDYLREAQAVVNRFVRERDKIEPCISCGKFHTGQYHAGHYRSIGSAPELRFDAEFNIHKQCSVCNNHLSGNLINYRRNLIIKIGLEQVEWLEGNHPPLKLTIDDIKTIKTKYKQLLISLRKSAI